MADGAEMEIGRVRPSRGDPRPPPMGEEAQRLLEVIEESPALVGTVDAQGRIVYLNRAGHLLLGIDWSDDPDGRIAEIGVETLHPPTMREFYWSTIVPAVKRDGVWEGDTEIVDRHGRTIPVSQTVVGHRAPPDADGRPGRITHLSTIVRDMRERTALEERLRSARLASERARDAAEMALAHAQNTTLEVNHRVKNLFALVPAIVQISARSAHDVSHLVNMVRERVAALSRSHELTLNEHGELTGIALCDLLDTVLEPYRGACEAIEIDGSDIRMNASDGNTLSLVLHELATNAAKHGALSNPSGRLAVRWNVGARLDPVDDRPMPDIAAKEEAEEEDGDTRWTVLRLTWRETSRTTPPLPIRTPERTGSGTLLLDRLVTGQKGSVSRVWHADGLELRITLPIHGARPARRGETA